MTVSALELTLQKLSIRHPSCHWHLHRLTYLEPLPLAATGYRRLRDDAAFDYAHLYFSVASSSNCDSPTKQLVQAREPATTSTTQRRRPIQPGRRQLEVAPHRATLQLWMTRPVSVANKGCLRNTASSSPRRGASWARVGRTKSREPAAGGVKGERSR